MNKIPIVLSFDIWNTLYTGNSKFKKEQAKIANKIFNIPEESFLRKRSTIKKYIDKEVETYGLHFCRKKILVEIFQTTRWAAIENFIDESNEIFLANPPLIINRPPIHIESTVCSNTSLIYSDVMKKLIKKDFGITTGNYSDMLGFSKPSNRMFVFNGFKLQPQYHIGDNLFTDSACKKVGIQFIHISEYDKFLKTLELV